MSEKDSSLLSAAGKHEEKSAPKPEIPVRTTDAFANCSTLTRFHLVKSVSDIPEDFLGSSRNYS
jgi:hypothetical protein